MWYSKSGFGNWNGVSGLDALHHINLKTVFLFGTSVLGVGAIMSSVLFNPPVHFDDANCEVGKHPGHTVAIVVDVTDGDDIPESVFNKLVNKIEKYRDKLSEGDKLTIYTLGSDKPDDVAGLQKHFASCKPRDPKHADPIVEGVAYLKRQYQENWVQPLMKVTSKIVKLKRVKSSMTPLLSGIKEIATASTMVAENDKTLLIVSDLLENSRHVSFYGTTWPDFSELKNGGYDVADVKDMLKGFHVVVWQLPHRDFSAERVNAFWKAYMHDTGAIYKRTVF